jgi:hypothetical protein
MSVPNEPIQPPPPIIDPPPGPGRVPGEAPPPAKDPEPDTDGNLTHRGHAIPADRSAPWGMICRGSQIHPS